eukprot:TRINITY_DN53354_c0_g1_i1.p2 TRINITY_DN53354_c0_g1~~TRINITY_DN53354_c0_g1_i1.p2  ORF type:complete len:127 (-),score=36.71 TRINITY_DN53354_c0_g1_i1:249-629(-)
MVAEEQAAHLKACARCHEALDTLSDDNDSDRSFDVEEHLKLCENLFTVSLTSNSSMPAAVEHFDITDEESQMDDTETQADDAFEWLASTGDFCPGEKVRQSRPGKIVWIMLTVIMTQFALLTPAGG